MDPLKSPIQTVYMGVLSCRTTWSRNISITKHSRLNCLNAGLNSLIGVITKLGLPLMCGSKDFWERIIASFSRPIVDSARLPVFSKYITNLFPFEEGNKETDCFVFFWNCSNYMLGWLNQSTSFHNFTTSAIPIR